MKRTNTLKMILWVLFLLYTGLMLYLLFFQRAFKGVFPDIPYTEALNDRFQLIPFRTIIEYFEDVTGNASDEKTFLAAFINLAGNVLLFIPLGFFLPALFEKLRKYYRTILTVVLIMMCIELIQAFTLLGSCDIDDLILNTAGGCIGYLIYCFVSKFLSK